jgi:glycosyltransferase involved in cell wall biosynthesis
MNTDAAFKVACFATQGTGSEDEQRIRALLEPLNPAVLPFDRDQKGRSAVGVVRQARRLRADIVVMEGTGIAGGLAVLELRLRHGIDYVVSSGDAVAPYIRAHAPLAAPVAAIYERLLCRYSAGFIGWTPYLAGRAMTLGAPRAMTAPGWAPYPAHPEHREAIRERLVIDSHALVVGLVGSLRWNSRVGYCYGAELVHALTRVDRPDVHVLIVGDGNGRERLEAMAEDDGRITFTGRVERDEVPSYLAAMDIASLPQSVDGVGSFRYTTKLSEYLAAGLPVITTQIPLAYDLDDGWLWRLPGSAPWEKRYLDALSRLMGSVTPAEVEQRRTSIAPGDELFDLRVQRRRVGDFVSDLLA